MNQSLKGGKEYEQDEIVHTARISNKNTNSKPANKRTDYRKFSRTFLQGFDQENNQMNKMRNNHNHYFSSKSKLSKKQLKELSQVSDGGLKTHNNSTFEPESLEAHLTTKRKIKM